MKTQATAILILLIAGTAMAQEQDARRSGPQQREGFLKQLDTDGDGKVSQAEFDGPEGPFARMDKNGDGFIDETEAQKGRGGPQHDGPERGSKGDQKGGRQDGAKGGGFMNRFDKDGDGKVALAEFDGPDEHFMLLDKNGDAFITEDEAPTGPPPGRGQRGQGGEDRP